MLNNIYIILVETSHPGNIGATARAMKNMGFSQLRLVNPNRSSWEQAVARAAGAEEILQQATFYPNLTLALEDCTTVIGTSARSRSLDWPHLEIHTDADKIAQYAKQHKLAIVFGRESSGLSNEELQRCDYQVAIPTDSEYSSLNLAAAVQIICYELFKTNLHWTTATPQKMVSEETANKVEIEGFYQHLEQVASAINYLDPARPGLLMPRFRRLFNRVALTKVEINILRGFLSAVSKRNPHAK